MQDIEYSPLVRLYQKQELRWREFLDRNFSEARILHWSPEHRVYRCGRRVVKIEWAMAASQDPHLRLDYEFSLLERLEGSALHLNPSYQVIDEKWHVLGMDWIEGKSLDQLIREGRAGHISVGKLLSKLFRISLAGVIYKQLRARHILRSTNGELEFIDFGGSFRANPLVALWWNFAPVLFTRGSWQTGRLFGLLHTMLGQGNSATATAHNARRMSDTVSPIAVRRWRANKRRVAQALPDNLVNSPGNVVAARNFAKMECCLREAVQIDPRICENTYKFYFADYRIFGNRDWGVIWGHIAQRVDFFGKRVVDLGCGMGCMAAFTRIVGGAHAISFDSEPLLLDAARYMAAGLEINGNSYRAIDWQNLADGSEHLPMADIISAMSVRFGDVPLERLLDILPQYPEILWQTSHVDEGRQGLLSKGYRTVEVVVQADVDQYILYAANRWA